MYSKRNWNTWKPNSQLATTRFIRLLLYKGFHNKAIYITPRFIFMNNKNNNNNLRHNTNCVTLYCEFMDNMNHWSLLLEACESGLFWKTSWYTALSLQKCQLCKLVVIKLPSINRRTTSPLAQVPSSNGRSVYRTTEIPFILYETWASPPGVKQRMCWGGDRG